MTCEEYSDRLLECVGSVNLPSDLAEHLSECEACRNAWTELKRLAESLAADADLSLGDEEIERLSRAVDLRIQQLDAAPTGIPKKLRARTFPGWPRLLASAAVIALVLGVGAIGYKLGQHSPPLQAESDSTGSAYVSSVGEVQSSALDESDIEGLLSDYAQNYSSGASSQLLDDISDDELEYLQTNLNVEGLL
ncbi:MAG: hypothetical protein ACE5FH_00580 [Candidatus Zixiibacteriota bacterium]